MVFEAKEFNGEFTLFGQWINQGEERTRSHFELKITGKRKRRKKKEDKK